jgi:predicted Abi (CAAX) family protease
MRIPQQPMVKGERFFSNLRDLENSPAGEAGWYIYGSRAADGVFTVQALQAQGKLLQLQPDQVVIGETDGLRYIDKRELARHAPAQRHGCSVCWSAPTAAVLTPPEPSGKGDYALLIHLFGGIGGENKEFTPAGTVTGHFAYGLARVVRRTPYPGTPVRYSVPADLCPQLRRPAVGYPRLVLLYG